MIFYDNFDRPEQLDIELEKIIDNLSDDISFSRTTKIARKKIRDAIEPLGWSSRVQIIAENNMTITSIKNNIAICTQTGNVCRSYADMMKLQYLYQKKKIDCAIMFVPTREFAYRIYSNGGSLTMFEKFTNELEIFKNIIKIPITVVGI
tara:strand:- start:30 stop:476 length:447 start_codon:yes stop_codon:yes gene_type:complete